MLLSPTRRSEMHVFCAPLKLQSQHKIPVVEWVPRNILKEQEKKKKRERKREGKRRDEKKESDKYFRSDNKFYSDQTR